jgi:hypothetical protein
MNPTSKKFISLFLIFSLMSISCTFLTRQRQKRLEYSKEQKQGDVVKIQKKDGNQIKGELIAVKQDSLLLLDAEGKDTSVDIMDIRVIWIKKSKIGKGAIYGALWGGLPVAASVGIISATLPGIVELSQCIIMVGGAAGLGAFIGAVFGTVTGTDKTILLEGMSDSEIQETMDKLRKKARIRDYK